MKYLLPLLLPCLLALTGCQTLPYAYPEAGPKATVEVSHEHASRWTFLPSGSKYDERTRIAVMGPDSTGLSLLPMFGAGGALIMTSLEKEAPNIDPNSISEPNFNLVEDLQQAINTQLSRNQPHQVIAPTAAQPGTPQLEVMTHGLVQFDKSGLAVVGVAARAQLLDQQGSAIWRADLFARADGVRPIDGPNGWSAEDNFEAAMDQAVERMGWAIIKLVDGDFNGGKPVVYKSVWSGNATAQEQKGFLVGENGEAVAIRRDLNYPAISIANRDELKIYDDAR